MRFSVVDPPAQLGHAPTPTLNRPPNDPTNHPRTRTCDPSLRGESGSGRLERFIPDDPSEAEPSPESLAPRDR
jgi:hypothetical protein